MGTAEETGDDERVWRCKECGARQPTPEPPCERCWNTTFVSGDGADAAAGDAGALPFGATAVQAAQVRTATSRSAALSGTLAVAFGGLHASLSLGRALDGLVFLGLVATAGATAVFLTAAVVAAVAYRA
ncbi:MAG: hypothetical protein ABEH83_07570, partial [Halobacterium sp.]